MADLTLPNANVHNKKYRGKNLTSLYSVADIKSMISNNTFDDLYLGDYFTLINAPKYDDSGTITNTNSVRVTFAGFNTYLYTGNSSSSAQYQTPHAIVLVETGYLKMCDADNTAATPYYTTTAYKTALPNLYTAYKGSSDSEVAAFGATILNHSVLLPSAFNTSLKNITCQDDGSGDGACSNFTWTTCRFRPLSEIERVGSTVLSSSPYYDTGSCNRHLPLFKLDSNNVPHQCMTFGVNGKDVTKYILYDKDGKYSNMEADNKYSYQSSVMAMIG